MHFLHFIKITLIFITYLENLCIIIIFHNLFSQTQNDREDKKSKIHFCYKWVEVEVINQNNFFLTKCTIRRKVTWKYRLCLFKNRLLISSASLMIIRHNSRFWYSSTLLFGNISQYWVEMIWWKSQNYYSIHLLRTSENLSD